ncbi:MAG: ABC transporter ATP-binding protein [Limnochordia bacterium]|jgi:branched-chain amino acid transport system ATP-binding protein
MNVLELKNISAHYGNIQALEDVSLTVNPGEIVCLLGANGAGKTTTIRVITGLLRPTAGEVKLDGKSLNKLPPSEIVRMGISCSPEGRQIFPQLTVMENLEMGAYIRRHQVKEVKETMDFVFSIFPILKEREQQAAGTLSGGQQQMLAIGRALLSGPRFLLLDEPSLGLAPLLVQEVFNVVQTINKEGVAILLVEQNAQQALNVSQRGYVLEEGKITLSDTCENLLQTDEIISSYLGAD